MGAKVAGGAWQTAAGLRRRHGDASPSRLDCKCREERSSLGGERWALRGRASSHAEGCEDAGPDVVG